MAQLLTRHCSNRAPSFDNSGLGIVFQTENFTAPPAATAPSAPAASSSDTPVGTIVGGVVGGLALLALLIVTSIWYSSRRKRLQAQKALMAAGQGTHQEYAEKYGPEGGLPREVQGNGIHEMAFHDVPRAELPVQQPAQELPVDYAR